MIINKCFKSFTNMISVINYSSSWFKLTKKKRSTIRRQSHTNTQTQKAGPKWRRRALGPASVQQWTNPAPSERRNEITLFKTRLAATCRDIRLHTHPQGSTRSVCFPTLSLFHPRTFVLLPFGHFAWCSNCTH